MSVGNLNAESCALQVAFQTDADWDGSIGIIGFLVGGNRGDLRAAVRFEVFGAPVECSASAVAQAAAEAALLAARSSVETQRQALQNNRALLLSELSAVDGVECVPPEGTFYCFPDFRAHEPDSQRLARLCESRVLTSERA